MRKKLDELAIDISTPDGIEKAMLLLGANEREARDAKGDMITRRKAAQVAEAMARK